ncbi:hypothetical protein [Gluconobacter sphaericus]|uniref:hypothetical protein n=1 Tax=Gluconobacter sphaericus TaxID=574987 RepID=UPI001143B49F|nr:hypothetical protein [Gluconobacter sphaericus]MBF0885568.1 hypothetical protein [Gluconobacter sphaericus]MBS1087310.1 hypothetical protein [Gluconobacter sphaericus]MBS1101224.1 hypothetical protein [Gluconobacter sphaericus]QQX90950.1 hypothetical protein IGS75_12605 [Gluconobacter sphaericus]
MTEIAKIYHSAIAIAEANPPPFEGIKTWLVKLATLVSNAPSHPVKSARPSPRFARTSRTVSGRREPASYGSGSLIATATPSDRADLRRVNSTPTCSRLPKQSAPKSQTSGASSPWRNSRVSRSVSARM